MRESGWAFLYARFAVWALAAFAIASPVDISKASPAGFPTNLENYLTTVVRLTQNERKLLMEGAPVTRLLDADANYEVAAFGAVWINAPMRRYVDALKDIESFERGGGFRITKRIGTPPRIEDFNALQLSKEEVADLRTCRVGDCELKLSQEALQTLRTQVNWKAPDARAAAESVMRQLAYEYVTGYLAGGNERLAVYRDKSRPTFVAGEFRSMIDQMPWLMKYMPDLRHYLLEYPKATLPNSTSFLYWQETQFGLKPTIRISHLVIQEGPGETAVASKMLYATHYFWTALELRVLVPDPSRGPGFWFVTVNRSRSDGLSGFMGRIIRWRVRSEVKKGAENALTSTKNILERRR